MSARLSFVLFWLLAPALAQRAEPDAGLIALRQAYLDLSTDAVVLNLAAHPDDEASRARVMLRRKYGARVITAYATYGDGGQNAIGREIGMDLARIRVRETLRAAAMSGVEIRWLGFPDFGFSKTLDETLRVWGRDRLLSAIRDLVDDIDPDLIITNHAVDRGHGHHRACAWAVRKVLEERAARGESVPPLFTRCGPAEAWITEDPGELDPLRGETYARMAYRAWVQHRSQGPWGPHDPLRVTKEWWRLVYPERERVPAAERATWGGWLSETPFRPVRDRDLDGLPDEVAGPIRLLRANVRVEAWLSRDVVAVDGEGLVCVVVHGHERLQGISVSCAGVDATPVQAAVRGRFFEMSDQKLDPEGGPRVQGGRFTVPFRPARGKDGGVPAGPEPSFVTVDAELRLGEHRIRVSRSLPYTVVPSIEIVPDRKILLVPTGRSAERTFSVEVRTHGDGEMLLPVKLGVAAGVEAVAEPGRLHLAPDHREARALVRVKIEPSELGADPGIRFEFGGASARTRIVPVDVVVPEGLRIGVIRGPEDTTERVLVDLGLDVTSLDRERLLGADLSRFDTLLLDIRANFHRPDLSEMRDRILKFCRDGGRVVVMYHKPREWNTTDADESLAPFPLTVGRERVTEEDAPVRFLEPNHPLFTRPNAIVAVDFDGWVQERGLDFPSRWDGAWTPLLEMKDSGETKSLRGSLLYTRYGSGDYVYCSLALYRQLRIGHAGAARLLVNLVAR